MKNERNEPLNILLNLFIKHLRANIRYSDLNLIESKVNEVFQIARAWLDVLDIQSESGMEYSMMMVEDFPLYFSNEIIFDKMCVPKDLCKMLYEYAKGQKITSGCVFVTKTGKPLDRSNIWKMMKALCDDAKVSKDKVYPHNLRHLFARTYYSLQKDIVRLADILGHSSINTTRIYTMESGEVHRRQIQKLGLLRI